MECSSLTRVGHIPGHAPSKHRGSNNPRHGVMLGRGLSGERGSEHKRGGPRRAPALYDGLDGPIGTSGIPLPVASWAKTCVRTLPLSTLIGSVVVAVLLDVLVILALGRRRRRSEPAVSATAGPMVVRRADLKQATLTLAPYHPVSGSGSNQSRLAVPDTSS